MSEDDELRDANYKPTNNVFNSFYVISTWVIIGYKMNIQNDIYDLSTL